MQFRLLHIKNEILSLILGNFDFPAATMYFLKQDSKSTKVPIVEEKKSGMLLTSIFLINNNYNSIQQLFQVGAISK